MEKKSIVPEVVGHQIGSKLTHRPPVFMYKREQEWKKLDEHKIKKEDIWSIKEGLCDLRNCKQLCAFIGNNFSCSIETFIGKTDKEIEQAIQKVISSTYHVVKHNEPSDTACSLYHAIIENNQNDFDQDFKHATKNDLQFRNYPQQETLAHVALRCNRSDMFRQIIDKAIELDVKIEEKGKLVAYVDAQTHSGQTLVHGAVIYKNKEALQLLQKHQVNFEIKNRAGITPFILAGKFAKGISAREEQCFGRAPMTIEEKSLRAEIVTIVQECLPKKSVIKKTIPLDVIDSPIITSSPTSIALRKSSDLQDFSQGYLFVQQESPHVQDMHDCSMVDKPSPKPGEKRICVCQLQHNDEHMPVRKNSAIQKSEVEVSHSSLRMNSRAQNIQNEGCVIQ